MSRERDCGEPATARVFWPGREPLLMCNRHAVRAHDVAAVIGVHVHIEATAEGTCTSKTTEPAKGGA